MLKLYIDHENSFYEIIDEDELVAIATSTSIEKLIKMVEIEFGENPQQYSIHYKDGRYYAYFFNDEEMIYYGNDYGEALSSYESKLMAELQSQSIKGCDYV